MSTHADALAVLSSWRAPTPEQDELRTAYVAHLRAHPDGLLRTCFPRHVTAGALVLDEEGRRVLLHLHAKAGRWFHFGGHVEPGDASLADAALREATEESGIAGMRLSAEPVQLSAHGVPFCDPRGTVTHLDVRYLARVPADTSIAVSEESLALRWWDVDDLPTREPDMVELVALALTHTG